MPYPDSLTWDSGGTHTINQQLNFLISVLVLAVGSLDIDEDSHIYIDARDNIPVGDKHAYVLSDTG